MSIHSIQLAKDSKIEFLPFVFLFTKIVFKLRKVLIESAFTDNMKDFSFFNDIVFYSWIMMAEIWPFVPKNTNICDFIVARNKLPTCYDYLFESCSVSIFEIVSVFVLALALACVCACVSCLCSFYVCYFASLWNDIVIDCCL